MSGWSREGKQLVYRLGFVRIRVTEISYCWVWEILGPKGWLISDGRALNEEDAKKGAMLFAYDFGLRVPNPSQPDEPCSVCAKVREIVEGIPDEDEWDRMDEDDREEWEYQNVCQRLEDAVGITAELEAYEQSKDPRP